MNVNDREATLSSNLANAENLRRDADVQIRDLRKRIEAHAALLETLPSRQTTQERTTPLTGALDQLTTQLVALKNQRTELLNKYPPTDRAVRQVELQIVQTEAGIRAASSPRSTDAATDINPDMATVADRPGHDAVAVERAPCTPRSALRPDRECAVGA